MKKRLGREVTLLSLPALLLGAVGLYQWRGGILPFLPNPLDRGPMRLEFSDFSPSPLTPLDVAQGYNWATQTKVRTVGVLNVPSNWRDDGNGGTGSPLSLLYRRGKTWKQAPSPRNGEYLCYIGMGGPYSYGTMTIKTNLSTIPRDAEEVRLRGQFRHLRLYRGPLPRCWKSPIPVQHAGLNHFFSIESRPYDVLVKGSGEKWPAPQVSHRQKFDCLSEAWIQDQTGDQLLVRFRTKPGSGLTGDFPCRVEKVRYFDAKGKPLKVFQDAKSTAESMVQGSMRQWVSPDLPKNEEVIRLMQPEARPRGGWERVKMPLTVTGIVSDGECWPTPFEVQVAPRMGELKDYGAP